METVNVKGYMGDVAMLGTDKDLVVIFHKGTKINEVKSKEAGTPIYDQLDFVKVIHPGEPLNVYDQPVREQDKWRFRQQWEMYQAGSEQNVSGTPLATLFPWNPEIVMSLGAMHITTVQQLANLSDTGKQNVMFGQNLSEKARQYLAVAEKGREYHELQAKVATQKEQIDELVKSLNDLRSRLATSPKRLGRPPKRSLEPEAA